MYEVHCNGQVVKCNTHEEAYAAAGKFYAQNFKPEIKTVGVAGGEVSIVAKDRIDAQHKAMTEAGFAGVGMGNSSQAYANGTRMMSSGYDTQAKRKTEFDALKSLKDVATELSQTVKAEQRHDIELSSGELSNQIGLTNGKILLGKHPHHLGTGARCLWQHDNRIGTQRFECWVTVTGHMFLIVTNSDGGWEIFKPVSQSNDIAETLKEVK